MRISDWSSDVCSSDLRDLHRAGDPRSAAARLPTPTGFPAPPHRPQAPSGARRHPAAGLLSAGVPLPGSSAGAARARTSVVYGPLVSVRVYLAGLRFFHYSLFFFLSFFFFFLFSFFFFFF